MASVVVIAFGVLDVRLKQKRKNGMGWGRPFFGPFQASR